MRKNCACIVFVCLLQLYTGSAYAMEELALALLVIARLGGNYPVDPGALRTPQVVPQIDPGVLRTPHIIPHTDSTLTGLEGTMVPSDAPCTGSVCHMQESRETRKKFKPFKQQKKSNDIEDLL